MKNSIVTGTFCATLAFACNVNAQIIDFGTYTQDTNSGLEWLDLTATSRMTYNQVTAELGTGGSLEGWRYATEADIVGFLDAFGGNSAYYYSEWNTQNNGLVAQVLPLWGDLYCVEISCGYPGSGYSNFIYDGAGSIPGVTTTIGLISDYFDDTMSFNNDYVQIYLGQFGANNYGYEHGSALVRDIQAIPLPAALWLFSSGFLGLIGVARRNVNT